MKSLIHALAHRLLAHRKLLAAVFALLTLGFSLLALQVRVEAGFDKTLPLQHPYMKAFTQYREEFGSANRVLIVLAQKEGTVWNPAFLDQLKAATDDVFYLRGIDRNSVTSLFTPNARYLEVVEDGYAGGNLVPARYTGSAEDLRQIQQNLHNSQELGRLIANDMSAALIRAEFQDLDPGSGERLDYRQTARALEALREKYTSPTTTVHIIGFAQAIGDIAAGVQGVLMFFALAFLITALLLYLHTASLRLTALALVVAVLPVIWLLGLLPLIGLGIDPLSILVPFLIFCIGVSHAVQMTNAWHLEIQEGHTPMEAARQAFIKLFSFGALALMTNALGFLVIMFIRIDIVRELGVSAALGVGLMILTNKILLPILLSWTPPQPPRHRRFDWDRLWRWLAACSRPRPALLILLITAGLLALAARKAGEMQIGDLGQGLPELRESSRYNRDSAFISERFSIGVDVLTLFAQSHDAGPMPCMNHQVMEAVDRYTYAIRQWPEIRSVMALPDVSKAINVAINEGNPRWYALPEDAQLMGSAAGVVTSGSGLVNADCSVMQIFAFTENHRGETLARLSTQLKALNARLSSPQVEFRLAGGNVGVMAATNEAVSAAETQMMAALFGALTLLCLLVFRRLTATLCIVLPLAAASLCGNALMALLAIGLKVSTLPVIALGVGVGVDYGIYLYGHLRQHLIAGASLEAAFLEALRHRGNAILFTAATMSLGVASWSFSALKFQADMGLLLAFMFIINMIGALLLLPALACFLLPLSRDLRHRQAFPQSPS